MKEKLRLLIREEVCKIFENYEDDDQQDYLSTFDFEDITDMKPGGDAYKAAATDIGDDFKEPSDKEVDDLISALSQSNLDLPSNDELIAQAKESLKRNLTQPEVEKIKKGRDKMQKMFGTGSYN